MINLIDEFNVTRSEQEDNNRTRQCGYIAVISVSTTNNEHNNNENDDDVYSAVTYASWSASAARLTRSWPAPLPNKFEDNRAKKNKSSLSLSPSLSFFSLSPSSCSISATKQPGNKED
jgi:hypothetical protein